MWSRSTISFYRKQGFTIIEILVVVAVIGIAFLPVIQVHQLSLRLSRIATERLEALVFVREGVEVLRFLRDDSFSKYMAPLSPGTTYYLSYTGTTYVISTTQPSPLDRIFYRHFTVANVLRDANDTIAVAGTNDPDTKRFTMSTAFAVGAVTSTESIDFYLMNVFQN